MTQDKTQPPARPRGARTSAVLIVDDHPIVRQGLAMLIGQTSDLTVCGEASNASEALEAIVRKAPDVALIDLTLGENWGIALIEEIARRHRDLPMLVVSMHAEELYAERSLRAGARGYLMKSDPPGNVALAIRAVLNGEIYVSDAMRNRLLNKVVRRQPDEETPRFGALSNRELEVFRLLGQGLSTREIAARLFLSVKTVETHCAHIKQKLSLSRTRELAVRAAECISKGEL